MSASNLRTQEVVLAASAARTTTAAGDTIEFPNCENVTFWLSSGAGTGSTPTLDVALQVTIDSGTTWVTIGRWAQVTSAAVGGGITMTSGRAEGEAAAYITSALTGGSLVNNTVLSRKVRAYWTIGGTGPSFTFTVVALVKAKD